MPAGAVPFPFGDCRVCNDHATGVHYGVITCEGCKGFFKRSTTREEKYMCFFGGSCVLTPQNRSRCKACRFQMCLKQGMAIDAVKMGRIPKLEKEKALRDFNTNQSSTMASGADFSSPLSSQQTKLYSTTSAIAPQQNFSTTPSLPPPQHISTTSSLTSQQNFTNPPSKPLQQNFFGTGHLPLQQKMAFSSKIDYQVNQKPTDIAACSDKDQYEDKTMHPNYFLELDKDPTADKDYFAELDKDISGLWRSNGKPVSHAERGVDVEQPVSRDSRKSSQAGKCRVFEDQHFNNEFDMHDNQYRPMANQSHWNLDGATKTTKTSSQTSNEDFPSLVNETVYGMNQTTLEEMPFCQQQEYAPATSRSQQHRQYNGGTREADLVAMQDRSQQLGSKQQHYNREQHPQQGVHVAESRLQDDVTDKDKCNGPNQEYWGGNPNGNHQPGRESQRASQTAVPYSEDCSKLHNQSATRGDDHKMDSMLNCIAMETNAERKLARYDQTETVDVAKMDTETLGLVESTIKRLKVAVESFYAPLKIKRAIVQDYFNKKVTMKFTNTDNISEVWTLLMASLATVNSRNISFCSNVPGFNNLDADDRRKLTLRAYLDIWTLSCSEFFIDEESYLIIGEGIFYSRSTMTEIMKPSIVNKMFLFAKKLNKMALSDFELGALCTVQLLTADELELENREAVEELHSHYLDVFIHTINRNHPTTSSRLLVDIFRLFPLLNEINKINSDHMATSSMKGPTFTK